MSEKEGAGPVSPTENRDGTPTLLSTCDIIKVTPESEDGTNSLDALLERLPEDFRDDVMRAGRHMAREGRDAPDLPSEPEENPATRHIEWRVDPITHRLAFDASEEARQDIRSKQCVDYSLSDMGNAQRIVHRYGRDLRYCYESGLWYIWNGSIWEADRRGLIYEIAKDTMIRVADEVEELDIDSRGAYLKFAAGCLNKSKIENAIALSQSINAVLLEDMDKDGFLLNLKNGTMNLRTWQFTNHRQADLITRCAGVEYVPDADCPTWKAHLSKIFAGDQEFIGELQEIFGYLLMAGNPEEIILICFGSGANGKSVTKEVLSYVLGTYGVNMDAQSLMVQKNQSGPRGDLARLQGARLITSNESETNSRLAESKIKELTGNDKITARPLYQEEREFVMSGKIMLCTNHKPRVFGQDPAIWRRLWLIPFQVTILKEERDYSLIDKLKAEGPGILNWLLVGFKKYSNRGRLPDSKKINAASQEYKSESDVLGEFLAGYEITGKDEDCLISRADLYAAYKMSVDQSEKPITKSKFNAMMQERIGKAPIQIHGRGLCWIGITVKKEGQTTIA